MKQKLKIASNWVSDEQESEAHKSDDKTNEECVNSLLHGIGIVLQRLLGGNKSANNSLRPTPNSNSECRKKGALGAPLKVDVIEGDGNCLFRAISYEVTLSKDHHGFFICLHALYYKLICINLSLNQGI